MPGLGKYAGFFVGLAAHLRHVRVPGYGFKVRVFAVRAHAVGEALQIGDGHGLCREDQQLVLQPSLTQVIQRSAGKRLRQVDVVNHRA